MARRRTRMNGSDQDSTILNGSDQDRPDPDGVDQPSLADIWEATEPGTRLSKGMYSIYKLPDDSLLLAYRAEGAEQDGHFQLPAAMVRMAFAAAEGKGPLGHFKGLAERQAARLGD